MDNRAGWIVAFAMLVFILALLIGFSMGTGSVADHCKDFGRFKESGELYQCSPRGKDGKP